MIKLLKVGLRPEEVDHVCKLFGDQKSVTKNIIRERWHKFLTPFLMDTYERYLVQKSDKKYGDGTIDAVAFSMFITDFVKGAVEDRVAMYTDFLNKNEEEEITIVDLQEYLVQLMKSVLLLMDVKDVTQYKQWSERGFVFTDDDIHRWTAATILNVYDLTKINSVSQDEMTSWMTLNTDVVLLQNFLFYSLYDLDKLESAKNGEQRSIHCPLPYLEVNVTKEDWKVIINIPFVTYINSHLPAENRFRWRLIYSADINGESFTTFRSLICNKGPSVLVVRDGDGHIFGGYASTSWHVGPKFFGDQRCFLFSLRPVMKIYPTLPHNDHFLYLNANQKALPNGLGMGGQLGYWGLWIDASFEFGSCSPSCSTYSGYQMLSGSPEFRIVGLEVWSAEGMYNLNDENGSIVDSISEDQEGSILHKDPGARALMDMLGKTGQGRDFLDA